MPRPPIQSFPTTIITLIIILVGAACSENQPNDSPKVNGQLAQLEPQTDACSDLKIDDFTGTWRGEKSLDSEKPLQIWTHVRRQDGTFEITFLNDDAETIDAVKTGSWSINGCVLRNLIRKINSKAVNISESYEINELTNTTIRYTHLRSGNSYTMKKTGPE